MSLHYLVKLKILIVHVLRNFLILTVASKFTRFESSWL